MKIPFLSLAYLLLTLAAFSNSQATLDDELDSVAAITVDDLETDSSDLNEIETSNQIERNLEEEEVVPIVNEPESAVESPFVPTPVKSDWDCKYSFKSGKCEPSEFCEYKYKFLDATISESCRRKNYTKSKYLARGGIRTKPILAVTGATALFAGDLAVIGLTPALKQKPLLTNVLQGFVLFFSGDTYFQIIEQGWAKEVGIKISRSFKSGLIGALNNGFIHFSFYKWIDQNFPYHKFTEERWGPKNGSLYKIIVAFAKYWIEWPTIGAYKIISSLILTSIMNNEINSIPFKVKRKFLLTWFRSLQIWPLYDTFGYAYLNSDIRPLYNSFMSIAWGGYLSSISQPETADEEVEVGSGKEAAKDEL
mmetsp:Transcript_17663/g.25020  ORF Transcript_17663/g.25020 Transcript_17663/m.25020 type:complete len:365 (-) Transcript_17663:1409-2503(-)